MSKVNSLQNKYLLHSLLSHDHGHMQKCNFLEYKFWGNLVQESKLSI